jgi:DNA-binding SARP family transcriptional activator
MIFSVLGVLRVSRGDREVVLSRRMSRALLGLLLARANHPVSGPQLIEDLWGEASPPSAKGALRVHLSNLRGVLAEADPDGPGRIEATAAGYTLTVADDELDAARFEQAWRTARQAADAGAADEVRALLEPALGWWRGPAYDGLGDYGPLAAEAVRLDELRVAALEALADAHLALGRPEAACDLLTDVALEHPWRESVTERLMLALYRSGRPADALRAYSRLRAALDEELGLTPGLAVRELEESIVVQRPELDLARGATRAPTVSVPEALPIVGRRTEMTAIARTWRDRAVSGPGLVLVSGPAGIGKTTLVERATAPMEAGGARVLVGHCDPEPSSDYEPVPQLIRAALKLVEPAALDAPILGELSRLVPDEADRLPTPPPVTDASTGRLRLFMAVSSLFEMLTAMPLVLVAEDLHWAGRDAFALLRHLLVSSECPMLIIGTYRDDELEVDGAAAAALGEGRLTRPDLAINLDGLDRTELSALVRSWGSEDLRSRMLSRIDELRDLTAGNPMFVREVLREVADSPDLPALDSLAPGGVRALVERRLSRLPAEARSTLSVAAVLGREFSVSLLATTAGISEHDALTVIDDALAAKLVVETDQMDRFAFSHPLVRNTIYSGTTTSRRARLHLRAGEILADDGASEAERCAECARHFVAALPLGDVGVAAAATRDAAHEASARFAHTDAVSWLRRATELGAEAGWTHQQLAATLLELGAALDQCGQRIDARATYLEAAEHARAADDGALLADAAIGSTPRYVTVYDFLPSQRELVDEALEHVGTDGRRLAWLLCCASAGRYYEEPGDKPYAVRALALARESDDPEIRATGLLTYHRWLTHDPRALEERLELSRELLSICRTARLDALAGRAARTYLIDLMGVGRLDDFDRELDELADFAHRNRAPADIYWVSAFRATRQLMIDPWGEAEELVRAARRVGRELQQDDAEGAFILHWFTLRYQQGRAREVTSGLETPGSGHPRILAGLSLLAAALVTSGRADDARLILDRTAVGGSLRLPHDNLWLGATALYSGVAASTGHLEQRALMRQSLSPFADQWCVFGAGGAVFGTGHHWLGQLAIADGDREAARSHLERAVTMSEAAGADYWTEVARKDLERISSP